MDDRARLIDRVLTFIDRPWKAVFTIFLIIIVGLGYAAWTERARIAEWIVSTEQAHLRVKVFDEKAAELLATLKADDVVLASLDLGRNEATLVSGWDVSGRRFIPTTTKQQIFRNATLITEFVRFMHNEVVCRDTRDEPFESEWEEAFSRTGLRRF